MIGELIVHILVLELLPDFDTVSPYFNMEEKSIRKGFDLLLFAEKDKEIWITEVKSGELHKEKDSNETTKDLLNTAYSDLNQRLNEKNTTFWENAINSVNVALDSSNDYKDIIEKILVNEFKLTDEDLASSTDNNVILISVLFSSLTNKIQQLVPEEFSTNQKKIANFNKLIVLSIQKETYTRVIDFFKEEIK